MSRSLRRVGFIAVVIGLLLLPAIVYADGDDVDVVQPEYNTFQLFPVIEGFSVPDPMFYAWASDGIFASAVSIFASFFLVIGTFILRFGIMILDYGQYPSFLHAIVEDITGRIQSEGWAIVRLLMPLVIIGSFILLGKDYMKGAASTTIRRATIFVVTLCIVTAAYAMPVTTLTKTLTGVAEFSSWISGKMMGVFAENEQLEGTDTNRVVYYQIWELLVYKPFEVGELGASNIRITKEEAEKINKMINPYRVKAGMRWGDIILWFPYGSDYREDIADYYADRYPQNHDYAQNQYFRLLVGLASFLVGLVAALFLIIMGGLLLALALYFIGLLCAGVIILPFTLIPSEKVYVLKYLTRIAGVFVAQLFISLYLVLTFIVVRLVAYTADGAAFLVGMLIVLVLFLMAAIMFFVLLSKMQSVPMFGEVNKVMAPANRAAKRMYAKTTRTVKRNLNERRQDKRQRKRDKYREDRMDERYRMQMERGEEYDPEIEEMYDDDDDLYGEDPDLLDNDEAAENSNYGAYAGGRRRNRSFSDRADAGGSGRRGSSQMDRAAAAAGGTSLSVNRGAGVRGSDDRIRTRTGDPTDTDAPTVPPERGAAAEGAVSAEQQRPAGMHNQDIADRIDVQRGLREYIEEPGSSGGQDRVEGSGTNRSSEDPPRSGNGQRASGSEVNEHPDVPPESGSSSVGSTRRGAQPMEGVSEKKSSSGEGGERVQGAVASNEHGIDIQHRDGGSEGGANRQTGTVEAQNASERPRRAADGRTTPLERLEAPNAAVEGQSDRQQAGESVREAQRHSEQEAAASQTVQEEIVQSHSEERSGRRSAPSLRDDDRYEGRKERELAGDDPDESGSESGGSGSDRT